MNWCADPLVFFFKLRTIVLGPNGTLRGVCFEAVNCRKFSRYVTLFTFCGCSIHTHTYFIMDWMYSFTCDCSPAGPDEWRKRIMSNFSHFKILYLTITVLLTAWSLLFNLWIMSGCILLVVGWFVDVTCWTVSSCMIQRNNCVSPYI